MAPPAFRRLVEHLPLVVYVDDLDELSTCRYVSPQIEALLGYTPQEWLAEPRLYLDSVHPADRDRVVEAIRERNRTGASTPSDDYRMIARDRRVVWVRDDEIVVRDEDGVPVAAHGYLQDVTGERLDRVRHELLAKVLSLAAEERTPQELISETAGALAAAVGDVTVTFVELTAGDTVTPRYTNNPRGLPAVMPRIPEAFAPLAHGPLVIEDVLDEPWLEPALPWLEANRVRSAVDVPLSRNGRVTAVMWFNTAEPRRWSAHEVRTLCDVAAQLAVVLERAEAHAQRARAELDLRRRDEILDAVSDAAHRLLAEPCWRSVADSLLERLGVAAGASRAYLFECHVREDGRLAATQRYEWCAPGIVAELENELMQDMCFADVGLARFEETCVRNEIFAGNVSDFPPGERKLFAAQRIRSIAAVPVFVDAEWWGFIGFDDCVAERQWSAGETDALRTAASLLSAAIGRERSELTLREHEQKLRAVFETALDAIFITNDERVYVDVNAAACEYLGVARRDLIGRRIDEFLPPHKLTTVEEDWQAYLAGGPALAEWETLRADGTVRIAEASAHPSFLPGLNIAFLRDVTERKRLEADLLSAQKLESLGRLAGGVAHDFNNLLTGITGYASLLLERGGDPELERDLGEIKRAADRAAELTKQLLAFGRRQVLKPRPLDLHAVLTEVGSMLRRLLGEDVALDLDLAPGLGTVCADPGQLEQVIVNLAVNARDAMPRGGRLTIAAHDADDGFVEIVFADTGIGMDEATLGRVFEPFFTTREQGVGLGLASVYGIVRQSGGDVTAASAPGAGSVFTVRLPRVAAAATAVADEPDEPASLPGAGTILLVEDEDVVRDLARRVLERQGYTVLACRDGASAVELAAADDRRIDLLLTDVVMPGLRGDEVARRIVASRPGIAVLFMSGYAEDVVAGRAELTGEALLEKPFAVDVLVRRVAEAIEGAYAALDSPVSA